MGYQLEVVRRIVSPELTRSERRSWLLHRQLARQLSRDSLLEWTPTIEGNVRRLRDGVSGEPRAMREKDQNFVAVLLATGLVDHDIIATRLEDAGRFLSPGPSLCRLTWVEAGYGDSRGSWRWEAVSTGPSRAAEGRAHDDRRARIVRSAAQPA